MEAKQFVWKEGQPVAVNLIGEKGGKNRLNPILPEYRDVLKDILNRTPGEGKMFKSFNKDVVAHFYKKEYAQNFGDQIQKEYTLTGKFDLKGYDCSHMVKMSERDAKGPAKRYGFDKEVAGVIAKALVHERISSIKDYLW